MGKLRTAWISSVVFSFIAVLGVGGFSFFLISNKSNTETALAESEIELADNQVFASILQNDDEPRSRSLRSSLRDSSQDTSLGNNTGDDSDDVFGSNSNSDDSVSDSDYEIFENDDISISELVAGQDESDEEATTTTEKTSSINSKGQKISRFDLLAMQNSADSGSAVIENSDDDERESRSDTGLSQVDEIPEEMEPNAEEEFDNQKSASRSASTRDLLVSAAVVAATGPENDDLVALNKFNNSNSAPVKVAVVSQTTAPKKSFNNLLYPDDEIEKNRRFEEPDAVDDIKDALDDFSNDLFEKDRLDNIRENVIAIIVNRENSEKISISDIKNMYIDKMVNWDNGGKIITYNLPVNTTAREIFSKKVLAMSAIQAATEASNRVITNSSHNRTHTKRDRLVLSYVARNPRAIGYVPLKTAKSSSKVRIILTME